MLQTLQCPPKTRLTPALWDAFLDKMPELRARIQRQTGWGREKIGSEMSHIYTSLSGRIHGHQIGDEAVTISQRLLTKEECLAVAALLQDFVNLELDPIELQQTYDLNEAQQGDGGGGEAP